MPNENGVSDNYRIKELLEELEPRILLHLERRPAEWIEIRKDLQNVYELIQLLSPTTLCRNCHNSFKAGRKDHVFCSDKCNKAYTRKNGATEHAYKQRNKTCRTK